jgi:hypothetical protein
MLEHYSHIRIDAKRQALDALDAARRGGAGSGNGNKPNEAEIETVVRCPTTSFHSPSAVERVSALR